MNRQWDMSDLNVIGRYEKFCIWLKRKPKWLWKIWWWTGDRIQWRFFSKFNHNKTWS